MKLYEECTRHTHLADHFTLPLQTLRDVDLVLRLFRVEFFVDFGDRVRYPGRNLAAVKRGKIHDAPFELSLELTQQDIR